MVMVNDLRVFVANLPNVGTATALKSSDSEVRALAARCPVCGKPMVADAVRREHLQYLADSPENYIERCRRYHRVVSPECFAT